MKTNPRYLLLSATIIIFGLFGCQSSPVQILTLQDFESFLKDEADEQKTPALAVLIFEGAEVKYENYIGLSNIEQEVALEQDHLFLLASISKTITATALLQLFDQGAFALDDRINDYLSFEVHVPGQTTDITFRMLLTHTSGIKDGPAMDDQYYYGEDSPVELSYFIRNYLVPDGKFYDEHDNFYGFEPGTKHKYSNIGTALIGVLVEEISGTDFNTYCRQNIFTPLDMNHSFWFLSEIDETIVQPYRFRNGSYQSIEHYTFTDYPNGGLRSTARDMFKFLSTISLSGSYNGHQLINESTVAEMITPQIPSIDDEVGLHMFLMNHNQGLWGHDGGEEGVSTIMAFHPDTKIGVLIFANEGDADLTQLLRESYKFGLLL